MTKQTLDCLGLKCPQPVLKVAAKAKDMNPGDVLEVKADCHSFPNDVETWCSRTGKTLLVCADEGQGKFRAEIQF